MCPRHEIGIELIITISVNWRVIAIARPGDSSFGHVQCTGTHSRDQKCNEKRSIVMIVAREKVMIALERLGQLPPQSGRAPARL